MEQAEGSVSKPCHQICDEQGVNEGHNMESLADDFKSLLIVPSNSQFSDAELRSDEVEIHSDVEEQGWCKITKNSDLCSAPLQNKSSNVPLVNGTDVPTEDTIINTSGNEIILNPVSDGYSSYNLKIKPMNESFKKVFKISLDLKDAICSLCLNIWHDVVTVSPCLHNFCNECFSEWSRRSQEEHAIVLCPHCSSDVQSVGRNHLLHEIKKKIPKSYSSLRRRDEDYAVVNSYPLIESLPVIKHGKKPRSKRSRVMREEDNNGTNLACAECGTYYGGFECDENMVHLQCHACGGMMPSRTGTVVPQQCIGCDGIFCGAYWHSQQVTRSHSYPLCHPDTFKPIGERIITVIPYLAHERNLQEQDVTESCIEHMGITLQDVVFEWAEKLNNQDIDLTRMPLKHAEMITSKTHVCNGCYDKLVSFFLYWFRICLPKEWMPLEAAEREDCWYGYACRTQKHNLDHARKWNHVCRPTKGSIGN